MRFPMLSNLVSVKKSGNGFLLVNELTDQMFSPTEYGDETFLSFISKLDGKHDPYQITDKYSDAVVTDILNNLAEYHLIRESRWLSRSVNWLAYSLIIPSQRQKTSHLPRVLNAFLLLSFIPIMIYGIYCLSTVLFFLDQVSIWGLISGVIFGSILHELGHAVAALSYGCRVLEAGVQLSNLVVPGAYTIVDNNDHLSTFRRVQLDAAGIEMNCLLGGVSFVLARYCLAHIDFFYCLGSVNFVLAALNLCSIAGNDGSNILSALLGVVDGNIIDIAKSSLFDRKRRSTLQKKGIMGRITLYAYVIILFMQAAIPALVIANIIEVMTWFA